MGKKVTAAVLAAALAVGSAEIAYAPGIEMPRLSGKQIESVTNQHYRDSNLEKLDREIAERIAIAQEQGAAFDSDPLYREVVSVYDQIKSGSDIPVYLTPEFFRGVVSVESSGDPDAVSYIGYYRGLTQMGHGAWKDAGKKDYIRNVFNSKENIDGSIKYFLWIDNVLSMYYPEWGSISNWKKLELDAQSYNFGFSNILSNEPLPLQTLEYFPKIIAAEKETFPLTLDYSKKRLSSTFSPQEEMYPTGKSLEELILPKI